MSGQVTLQAAVSSPFEHRSRKNLGKLRLGGCGHVSLHPCVSAIPVTSPVTSPLSDPRPPANNAAGFVSSSTGRGHGSIFKYYPNRSRRVVFLGGLPEISVEYAIHLRTVNYIFKKRKEDGPFVEMKTIHCDCEILCRCRGYFI